MEEVEGLRRRTSTARQRRSVHEMLARRILHDARVGFDAELLADAPEVGADRTGPDIELLGDLGRLRAAAEESEDLKLPRAEALVRGLSAAEEVVRHLGRDVLLAARDLA